MLTKTAVCLFLKSRLAAASLSLKAGPLDSRVLNPMRCSGAQVPPVLPPVLPAGTLGATKHQ